MRIYFFGVFVLHVLAFGGAHGKKKPELVRQAEGGPELPPDLQEFKDALIAALEVPEAVAILRDLFEFLSQPVPDDIVVLHKEKTSTKDEGDASSQNETDDATSIRKGHGTAEQDAAAMRLDAALEDLDDLNASDAIPRRMLAPRATLPNLDQLSNLRYKAGEVVGNVLYGKQGVLQSALTPNKGPLETVLTGRGRGRKGGLLG